MSRRSATTVKVFVGSLPPGTTSEELRELFAPYGEIAECDVVNRCGFLHLEDKALAFKAIDDLNNTTFKGTRISVEKGRVKPPNRDRGGPMRGGPRNGFGGPMRGGRDNYRGSPYMRDDYDRPPRGGPPRGGGGFGGGYDRGYGGRPGGPMNSRPMNDSYGSSGDRRPYMDDRSGGYGGGNYGGSGYGMNSGGGNNMYNDNYNMNSYDRMDNRGSGGMNRGGSSGPYDRRPMMEDKPMDDRPMMGERRPPMNDRAPPMMEDRRPVMSERRPLLDNQGPSMGGSHPTPVPPPNMSNYDRRPQGGDMYSRRDPPQKPMGSGGYGEPTRNTQYDTAYPPIQSRSFSGGPGPRREMPPVRRF